MPPSDRSKELTDAVADLVPWGEWRDLFRDVALPIFRDAFRQGAEAATEDRVVARALRRAKAIDDVGYVRAFKAKRIDFRLLDALYLEQIEQYFDDWWGALSNRMQRELRDLILEATQLEQGAEWVASRLEDRFGTARAQAIAVTETTRLMGRGAQATYKALGFAGWAWRTVEDSFVDQDCIDRARASDPRKGGTPYAMGMPFVPAHVNCRCWPVPIGKPTLAPDERVLVDE